MTLTEAWLPWLAVAGLGALHGLNPANGWMFLATGAARGDQTCGMRRCLASLAVGHLASVALVVAVVMDGLYLDRAELMTFAGCVLIAIAVTNAIRQHARRIPMASVRTNHSDAPLALWSCLMGTAHGSGLMLVPALIPLCMNGPARAITTTGSFGLMITAVALHMLAMLFTMMVIPGCFHRCFRRFGHLALLESSILTIAGAAMIASG